MVSRPDEFRHCVVRDTWTVEKRFGAIGVQNIEQREVPFLYDEVVTAYIDDPQRAIIGALVKGLGAGSFFEIGTNRGRITWTVAHHNPGLRGRWSGGASTARKRSTGGGRRTEEVARIVVELRRRSSRVDGYTVAG